MFWNKHVPANAQAKIALAGWAGILLVTSGMNLNISRFDLLSIQIVVFCAAAGSLTAAAKRANCSISSGSQRIAAIERAVGQKLFERDYRGLRLTEFGVLFVRHASEILAQFEQMKSHLARAVAERNLPSLD